VPDTAARAEAKFVTGAACRHNKLRRLDQTIASGYLSNSMKRDIFSLLTPPGPGELTGTSWPLTEIKAAGPSPGLFI